MSEDSKTAKLYRYSVGRQLLAQVPPAFMVVFFCGLLASLCYLWFHPRYIHNARDEQWLTIPIGAMFLVFNVLYVVVFWNNYLRCRPIVVSVNSLGNYALFNKVWRSIRWDNVVRAERRRFYNALFSQYESTYTIEGTGVTIKFTSAIEDLKELLEKINHHIRARNVECVFVDMAPGTRKEVKSTEPPTHGDPRSVRRGVAQKMNELERDDEG